MFMTEAERQKTLNGEIMLHPEEMKEVAETLLNFKPEALQEMTIQVSDKAIYFTDGWEIFHTIERTN